jgi:hypothetical protein
VEWNAGRLPAQHLVEFVRSIAWQSRALTQLFATSWTVSPPCELLSAADMQVQDPDNNFGWSDFLRLLIFTFSGFDEQ